MEEKPAAQILLGLPAVVGLRKVIKRVIRLALDGYVVHNPHICEWMKSFITILTDE
jgi:hypothetical protein